MKPSSPKPSPPSDSARILVADDEPLVRDLLANLLTRKGHEVLLAADGEEALKLFRGNRVDLVLSDVRMPGVNGLQLLKAVKDANPRVPVVLISGYGQVETVVDALKAGAESFLAKPLHMDQLSKVVDQALNLVSIRPGVPPTLPEFRQASRMAAPSNPDYIGEIVYQIALSAVAVGFAEIDLDNNVKLALVEAITNGMEHGNQWNDDLSIQVESTITRNLLEVTIRDQGPGFDPAQLPDPTSPEQLLCERGRGIFLIRSIMDEVIFTPPNNVVTIRKINSSLTDADSE